MTKPRPLGNNVKGTLEDAQITTGKAIHLLTPVIEDQTMDRLEQVRRTAFVLALLHKISKLLALVLGGKGDEE